MFVLKFRTVQGQRHVLKSGTAKGIRGHSVLKNTIAVWRLAMMAMQVVLHLEM